MHPARPSEDAFSDSTRHCHQQRLSSPSGTRVFLRQEEPAVRPEVLQKAQRNSWRRPRCALEQALVPHLQTQPRVGTHKPVRTDPSWTNHPRFVSQQKMSKAKPTRKTAGQTGPASAPSASSGPRRHAPAATPPAATPQPPRPQLPRPRLPRPPAATPSMAPRPRLPRPQPPPPPWRHAPAPGPPHSHLWSAGAPSCLTRAPAAAPGTQFHPAVTRRSTVLDPGTPLWHLQERTETNFLEGFTYCRFFMHVTFF